MPGARRSGGRSSRPPHPGSGTGPLGGSAMTQAQAERHNPVLEEASRELEAAVHDAQVAFDCIALGEFNRAHTSALTARVAADAAVTPLPAALLTAGAAAGACRLRSRPSRGPRAAPPRPGLPAAPPS